MINVSSSAVERLAHAASTVLLGQITLAIRDDSRVVDRLTAIAAANRYFGERPDFRVWHVVEAAQTDRLNASLETEDLFRWIDAGLQSEDSAITWGMLATAPTLVTTAKYGLRGNERITRQIENRLARELPPVPGSELECEIVWLLATAAMARARNLFRSTVDEAEPTSDLAQLKTLVDRFESVFRRISPGWFPGRPLFMDAFKSKDLRRVGPLDSVRLSQRITDAIQTIQQLASRAVTELTVDTEDLLDRVTLLAMSGWKTIKFELRGEEKHTRNSHSARSAGSIRAVQRRELTALFSAAKAAKDSGRVLLSAALGHLLLRVVPEDLVVQFDRAANSLCLFIRQAGLSVDGRFRRDREINRGEGDEFMDGPYAHTWPGTNAWRARIKSDQTSGKWEHVLPAYGPGGGDLRRVLRDAERGTLEDTAVIQNAFQLYLRYGWIEEACSVLELHSFCASKRDLIDFAHSIKRAMQIMPFGCDDEVVKRWHSALIRRWSTVVSSESVTLHEALIVHEVLLGRASSAVMNMGGQPGDGQRLFARRYYGDLTDQQIREMLANSPEVSRRGPATATLGTVKAFLKDVASASFGTPVFVSVVDCGSFYGILGVGADGRWEYRRIEPNGRHPDHVKAVASVLEAGSASWVQLGDSGERLLEIPWGAELQDLAITIADVARQIQDNVQWIMLAIDPDLAGLPWQNLFALHEGGRLLVTMIPSISAATLHMNRHKEDVPADAKLSLASDLQILRRQIEIDVSSWKFHGLSIACVLGHGVWSDTGRTTVESEDGDLTFENWLDLVTRRVVVVHSCFGGKISECFSGDLGGLPGIGLAMGSRVFCAPVSAVPVETATVLHRHLFHAEGPADIGSRYIAAMMEEPAVGLYNVYGFAGDVVG